VRYWYGGKLLRESAKTERRGDAVKLLNRRLGDIGCGRQPGGGEDRVTFKDLAADYLRDYAVNKRRSTFAAGIRVDHLRDFFGDVARAGGITTDRIRLYVEHRQAEGAGNATINRETSALGRMFRLALQARKLQSVPYIPKLQEPPPRQGFLEPAEFEAILPHLPGDLQDVFSFAYNSGWRKSEILSLEWRDVDVEGEIIRLRPDNSKNREPRLLPLSEPIRQVIARRLELRTLACPYVFHRFGGKPIKNLDGAWRKAREAAGCPDKLLHDCRRTAARSLIRAGVGRDVARRITGHKTDSVFSRYNVTTESDLRDAAEKLAAYMKNAKKKAKVQPFCKAAKA
jgi:integrase